MECIYKGGDLIRTTICCPFDRTDFGQGIVIQPECI